MPHKLTAYEVTYIINVTAHNMDEAVELAVEASSQLEPDVVEVVPDEEEECDDEDCPSIGIYIDDTEFQDPEWGA